jgi:argininosuccinate lyase
MYDAAANSYAISIDIAEQLVLRHGLAFRSAHRLVGLLVERAVSTNNLPLSKLDKNVVRTVLENVEVNLDVDALVDLISEMTPERSLELRVSEGSPNLDQQQSMIKLCNTKAAGYRSGISKRKSFVKGAFESVSGTVRNYLDKY